VVRKQTRDTAALYGLSDRGTIEVGKVGDFNVIDYERLQLGSRGSRPTCRPAAAGSSRTRPATWPP